jgi:tetratricopeptide (TPR) repeat protein
MSAIRDNARSIIDKVLPDGTIFGPYRILREIGRGGMGLVFEAVRDDDEYRKRVALKIAPSWRDAALLRERLRHERQILADLEHPYIARFLDGGTEGGVPYIAMEFVEGVPITAYCRSLPLRDRVRLFREVCAAVRYAHEHLIVHRDLKPGNILVTSDGVPKLLDFGIAKILSPLAEGGATTGLMLWTPDYTSPEQVRGRPVTTRTDIYSLGLILYELLTGTPAQPADTTSPLELDRSVCEREPPPAGIDRDLDSIVRMAIRKEPERRYGSVAELNEDLNRYLEARPVRARPSSVGYRAWKLVRRHRAGAAAAVLVLASLAAGAVSTIHQARRAERRFQQVHKLANTFVFDVHDRIQSLPGATEARKFIVQTALAYLETLQPEASGDSALLREIAGAYVKIGDVQGAPSLSNLGDTTGALASYGRAEAILSDLVRRGDSAARLPLASAYYGLGSVRRARGDSKAAMESYAKSRELCERLLRESSGNRELLTLAGELYSDMNRALTELRDAGKALEAAASAMEIAKKLVALDPADRSHRMGLATAISSVGRAHLTAMQLEEAVACFREAIAIREQVVREQPQNAVYQRDLMIGYGTLGDILGSMTGMNLGDTTGATAAFHKAFEIAQWLTEKDPADRKARFDLFSASHRLGVLMAEDPEQAAAGMRRLEDAERIIAPLMAEDPKNARFVYHATFVERKIGEALVRTGRERDGARRLEHAASVFARLIDSADGLNARQQMTLANARLATLVPITHALQLAETVERDFGNLPAQLRSPWVEVTVYRDLGRAYLRAGRLDQAAAWLEKSCATLQELKAPAALEPKRRTLLASIQADLAAVEASRPAH